MNRSRGSRGRREDQARIVRSTTAAAAVLAAGSAAAQALLPFQAIQLDCAGRLAGLRERSAGDLSILIWSGIIAAALSAGLWFWTARRIPRERNEHRWRQGLAVHVALAVLGLGLASLATIQAWAVDRSLQLSIDTCPKAEVVAGASLEDRRFQIEAGLRRLDETHASNRSAFWSLLGAAIALTAVGAGVASILYPRSLNLPGRTRVFLILMLSGMIGAVAGMVALVQLPAEMRVQAEARAWLAGDLAALDASTESEGD